MTTRLTIFMSLSWILALSSSLPGTSGLCKSKSWSCLSGHCQPSTSETLDPTAQSIIWQASHQPELMNIEYLKYFIGRPANEKTQRGSLSKSYFWYDDQRQPRYELHQSELTSGQVVDSTLVVHLKGQGLTFEKLHPLYGNMSRRFYDYGAHPCELFSFAPSTFLSFSQETSSFRLSQAKITYRGPALPPPGEKEMQAAEEGLILRSTAGQMAAGTGPDTIPLLRARLKCHPVDAESHYLLARALASQSLIQEAIGEYKIALALSGNNPEIRQQSLSALRQMHIIAPGEEPVERRNMEIVDSGQHIRVQGHEKRSHKKDSTAPDGKNAS